ncbi:hypothetical protein [Nonomuraea sp. NPDC003727]
MTEATGCWTAAARGGRHEGAHTGMTPPWKVYYDGYVAAGVPSGAPVPSLDDAG